MPDPAAADRDSSKVDGEVSEPEMRSSQKEARRILIGLMFPAMLMPLVSSTTGVALPVIRDDFGLQADVTAWVAAVFTLPFMILMSVYGRLSDGLGQRSLLLAGIAIFSAGTAVVLASTDLAWLMAGRAVQGVGLAGMMPLGIALVSSIFRRSERGRALGTWSTVGPTTACLGPLVGGFLITIGGWRAAFALPLLAGLISFLVVYREIPSRPAPSRRSFLRWFDWGGVALLAAAVVCLVFFLSSRSITGVAPLRDWRLLAAAIVLLGIFTWWERRCQRPFVPLSVLTDRMFARGSLCAAMRMVGMGGLSLLMPLYLVDVQGLHPAELGGILMIGAGSMALVVRLAGGLADRWSSRWLVVVGFALQVCVMLIFSRLPGDTPLVGVAANLSFHGFAVGLMLATLHRAVMGDIPEERMGAAAGLYSMLRFLGAVTGTALAGVLLQGGLDAGLPMVEAYQRVFFLFAGFAGVGMVFAFSLRER